MFDMFANPHSLTNQTETDIEEAKDIYGVSLKTILMLFRENDILTAQPCLIPAGAKSMKNTFVSSARSSIFLLGTSTSTRS